MGMNPARSRAGFDNQAKRVCKLACKRASADCSASASPLWRSKAQSAKSRSAFARKEYYHISLCFFVFFYIIREPKADAFAREEYNHISPRILHSQYAVKQSSVITMLTVFSSPPRRILKTTVSPTRTYSIISMM